MFSTESILEIGAGFGRTAHAIIKNFHNVKTYTIIDLEPCLNLSSRYLMQVLTPEEYRKINFVRAEDAEKVDRVDLSINIDSIAEMNPDVCYDYLRLIDKVSEYFYSRNPICKYSPASIGIENITSKDFDKVLNLGLCRKVIDIFDEEELSLCRREFESAYLPSRSWSLTKSEVSKPWQYYHHALYKK